MTQPGLEIVLQNEGGGAITKTSRCAFREPASNKSGPWRALTGMLRLPSTEIVRNLFPLGFIERQQDVIFLGPVGVGKTFLACALGHAACRAGREGAIYARRSRPASTSRADHSTDKVFRRLLAPDLLIIDDFALPPLDLHQSSDFPDEQSLHR